MFKFVILPGLVLASAMASASPAHAIPTLGTVMGTARTEVDSGHELFFLTDTSGVSDDATVFLLLELAGNANDNAFGIYDPVSGNSLEIFAGADSPLGVKTLSWVVGTNAVNLAGTAVNAIIDNANFGFYLDSKNDGRFYSQTALNVGPADLMASYNIGGLGYSEALGSNLIIAFEDTLGGDLDFNDFVVGVSDIAPKGGPRITSIPEPRLPMLLGIGLVSMGFIRKVKS